MTRRSERQLGYQFTAEEVGDEPNEEAADEASGSFSADEDDRPLVVFLISGIRSSKTWAQNFTIYSKSIVARKIIPIVIGGSKDLTTIDLLFRCGIEEFCADYLEEISDALIGVKNSDVSFICHSMGSAIFPLIIDDIRALLECQDSENRINAVVFLGGICKKRFSGSLRSSCNLFVNDVGLRDIPVVIGSILNPHNYDPVGRFGFARGAHVVDRYFPDYSHADPTTEEHLSEWVLPIIEQGIIRSKDDRVKLAGFTLFRYARRLFYPIALVLTVLSLCCNLARGSLHSSRWKKRV